MSDAPATRDDLCEEDLVAIGLKVIEMADRVEVMNLACPGTAASWHFEMDDLRFRVALAIVEKPDGREA